MKGIFLAAALAATAAGGAAQAAQPDDGALGPGLLSPSRFYVHAGPAALIMDESAKIYLAGQRLPGATVQIDPLVTAVVEAGYMITPNIGVSATGGYPPTAHVEAAGSLAGYGEVGRSMFGPVAVTAHYHFTGLGPLHPYVGAGPAFLVVMSDHNGILRHFNVEDSVGAVVQGGAEWRVNRHWGVFFDVKKAWLGTTSTGYLGPAPVRSDVTLNPLVLNGGLSLRF